MTSFNMPRIITALVTPLFESGAIDFDSLSQLVRMQEQAGNAILILGSTGEGLALSLAEKRAVLHHVFSLTPAVPIMVGVGGFQLEEQLSWMVECQENYSLESFLLVTPLYAKPGIKGQIAWFKALLDQSERPCILYNIPGRAGVKLYPEVLAELAHHPRLGGLKEASGNLAEFSAYQEIIPHLPIYSGNDELLKAHVERGAFGVISVASNIWPWQTRTCLALCLAGLNSEGKVAMTEEGCALWERAANHLFVASNPIPVKILLQQTEQIRSATLRLPLTSLELDEVAVQALLKIHDQIIKCRELNPC